MLRDYLFALVQDAINNMLAPSRQAGMDLDKFLGFAPAEPPPPTPPPPPHGVGSSGATGTGGMTVNVQIGDTQVEGALARIVYGSMAGAYP